MRKAAIQSQKSHMSPAYVRAARPGHAMNRRRPMIRASQEATRREYVFVASRQGSPVACMVNTSVVPVPGVRHVSRPAIAVATASRILGGLGARSTGANGARGGSSGRGPGEGNAVPSIRKGTRRIIRGRRVSVSGETTSPWLSPYESLPDA